MRAAAAAGFDGIGFFAGQYPTLGDGWDATRIHELLDRHDIVMAEVEALSGWGAHDPPDRYVDFERLVWTLVDEFDVPYVQAIGPTDGSIADAGRRFGELCDRAADHGATVGLEFLPFTNIVDASDAVAIVEAAARPNGGVCADIWHHARGADDLDLIRRIPPELLVRVQMSDGPPLPTLDDYKDDCLRYRVPPGDGALRRRWLRVGRARPGLLGALGPRSVQRRRVGPAPRRSRRRSRSRHAASPRSGQERTHDSTHDEG